MVKSLPSEDSHLPSLGQVHNETGHGRDEIAQVIKAGGLEVLEKEPVKRERRQIYRKLRAAELSKLALRFGDARLAVDKLGLFGHLGSHEPRESQLLNLLRFRLGDGVVKYPNQRVVVYGFLLGRPNDQIRVIRSVPARELVLSGIL